MTMRLPTFTLLLALAAQSIVAAPLCAQGGAPASASRAHVLILGAYHMAGGSDFVQSAPDDVLSPHRQREMEDLVTALATYRPTKILVESTPDRDSTLNAHYQRYREGRDTLGRNEIDQVALRLAKRVGLPGVSGIDFRQDEDMNGVMRWAAQHGDTGFVRLVNQFVTHLKVTADSLPRLTVAQYLLRINDPAADALGQGGYLRMVRVGGDTSYPGAEVVAGRYHRNLRIFANMTRRIEAGDRVLVLYGSGHDGLLREFVRGSSDLALVSPHAYLAAAGTRERR